MLVVSSASHIASITMLMGHVVCVTPLTVAQHLLVHQHVQFTFLVPCGYCEHFLRTRLSPTWPQVAFRVAESLSSLSHAGKTPEAKERNELEFSFLLLLCLNN